MPRIAIDKVCYVIAKARELDVKVAPSGLHDDDPIEDEDDVERILEEYADDPIYEELHAFLESLNDEEIEDLVALTWIGRGDFGPEEWDDVLGEVRDVREQHSVEYLIGTPLLGDYLEEGLAQFGLSCEDVEIDHL